MAVAIHHFIQPFFGETLEDSPDVISIELGALALLFGALLLRPVFPNNWSRVSCNF